MSVFKFLALFFDQPVLTIISSESYGEPLIWGFKEIIKHRDYKDKVYTQPTVWRSKDRCLDGLTKAADHPRLTAVQECVHLQLWASIRPARVAHAVVVLVTRSHSEKFRLSSFSFFMKCFDLRFLCTSAFSYLSLSALDLCPLTSLSSNWACYIAFSSFHRIKSFFILPGLWFLV